MNKRKKIIIVLSLFLFVLLFSTLITLENFDLNKLKGDVTGTSSADMIVHAIDYGDGNAGDAVLVESNGQFLLMDVSGFQETAPNIPCAGYTCINNNSIPIIKYLKKVGVKKLSIYISHYDHDHIGNIKNIIEYKEKGTSYFDIDKIYLPNISVFENAYNALKKEDDGTSICNNASKINGELKDATLKCRYKITLGQFIGKAVKEDSDTYTIDKKVYDLGGGNTYGGVMYIDPYTAYYHHILPKDKIVYIDKNSEITIGTSTLKVLYYNPNTNPLNYYKNGDYPNNWYGQKDGDNVQNERIIASFKNNISLVSMITTKDEKLRFYTAGDIQYEIEQEIVNKVNSKEFSIKADLMKLSHHGENTSNFTTNNYINKISPTYAFYQHGAESSYINTYFTKSDGKKVLKNIEFTGLKSRCKGNNIQGKKWTDNCYDSNMTINNLGIDSKYINSSAVSGTIRYVFNGKTLTRQCASTSCDSVDSVKVIFKKNDGISTGSPSQTFEVNYIEPYKFGYNYQGNYFNFLEGEAASTWTAPYPFDFGAWTWNKNSTVCNTTNLESGKCVIAYWTNADTTDINEETGKINKYRTYVSVNNSWIKKWAKKHEDHIVTMNANWKPLYTYSLKNEGATTKGTETIYGIKDADTISSSDTGIFLNSIETQMTPGKNLITKPTKKGSTFLGYNTKADGTGTMLIDDNGSITDKFTISNSSYQKDLTLYAIWLNESPECDAIDSTNIVSNTQVATISCNDDTKIVSYYFQKGDKTDSSTFTTISSPNKKITKSFNITEAGTYYLYVKDEAGAISTKKTITYYGTTFNMKNGTVSPSYSKVITEKGREFQLPTPKANDGYKLAGKWYTNSSYTEGAINYGSSYTPSKSATLYSQATNIPPECEKLQYTNNVSSSQFVTVHCEDATKIVGYYFDKNKDNVEDSQFISVNKNIRFDKDIEVTNSGNYYFMVIDSDGARSSIKSIKFIKTTFNMDKGSVSPSTVLTKDGETFQLPKPTADKGYSAIGNWYNDKTYSSGTRAYESDYTPSANKTFFSKATANTYTVTFNANGGTGSMTKITMTYDVEQKIPKNTYTKSGYKFIGWSLNKDGPVQFADEEVVSNLATSGTKTLYAQWTKMVSVPTCSSKPYTGSSQTLLSAGTGYTVSNNTGTNAGNYTVTLTLKTGYVWSDNTTTNKTVTCTISPLNVSKLSINVPNKIYSGKELIPNVTVKHETTTLVKDTDYTVVLSDNIEVGTGHATITMINSNYTGSITKDFIIYSPDDMLRIIDSSIMELSDDIIYTTLLPGVNSLNKNEFWKNINVKGGTWLTYDKNDTNITDNGDAIITTGSYLKYGVSKYPIIILGDITQDGIVSIKDMYQSYLLYKNKATGLNEYQLKAGDYNKDGSTNIKDLYEIYKKMKEK